MERKTVLHVLSNATDSSSQYAAILGVDNYLIDNIKLAVNILNKDNDFKGVRSISLNDMFYVAWLKPDIFESIGDSNFSQVNDFSFYPMPQMPDKEIMSMVNKYRVKGEMQTCDLIIDTNNTFSFFSHVVDMDSHIISKYRTQPIHVFQVIEAWDKAQKQNMELSCAT